MPIRKDQAMAGAIEARLRDGHPPSAQAWIAAQEHALAKPMAPAKRGPKART